MANGVLPQLNIADFEPQIFWLLIIFFVFYLVVKVKIVPYFNLETENRDKKISNNFQDAKKLRYKADRLAHDYNEKIQAVHLRANDLIAEAKLKVSHRLEEEKKRLNSELSEQLNVQYNVLQEEYKQIDATLINSMDALKDKAQSKVFLNSNNLNLENLRGRL
ncbi:MAG: F-type H+-transporting ATPase subunit b [Alphaproteobacteria bacterium]|jgi:F-type H+-transporting ATPase subunit b